ncbi:hypothetical protein Tco_0475721 [Tanacetum coccineum]
MPRSLSLRTPAHFQLGSLLARLALAQNSQLTLPTQRREVVYLLSLNMPIAFRSLTQDSLVYLLASAIPHLSFQGSPRSGSERTLIHESGLEELEGIGFNPATCSPYGYLVVNERPDLYSSNNLLLMIKKKEEKELGSFEKTGRNDEQVEQEKENNTKVPVKENENGEAEKFDPNNANIQSLLKKREKEELAMGGLGQLPIVEGLELIEEFNVGASASGSMD